MRLLQVHTIDQNAVRMVATYPCVLNAAIYEVLATSQGEPSAQHLMGQLNDSNHNLSWNDVVAYVNRLTTQDILSYVPFAPNCPQEVQRSAAQFASASYTAIPHSIYLKTLCKYPDERQAEQL